MYKEKVKELCHEAFKATKRLVKENGGCVCAPEKQSEDLTISISGIDSFEAIVYNGSFVDDMEGYVADGVRINKKIRDPYGDPETLEIKVGNCRGDDFWADASRLNWLCYPDMYAFVKNFADVQDI